MTQRFLNKCILMILVMLLFSACLGKTIKNDQIDNQITHSSSATSIPTATVELTETPTVTPTRTQIPTETHTPSPTIGVGSSKEAEDGSMLKYIPAGEFMMGSDTGKDDEKPVHPVYLDAFWMSETEVTCERFSNFIEEADFIHPWTSINPDWLGYWPELCIDKPYHPVRVDWHVASAYCDWIGLRLPTEAEWEKAARGGLVGKRYPWGDAAPICEIGAENGAMFFDGENCVAAGKVPVKSYQPNGYGLFDMAGNAAEWVWDLYVVNYYDPTNFESTSYENPQGPQNGYYHIVRGGSERQDSSYLRCASRDETVSLNAHGFRCVLSADE